MNDPYDVTLRQMAKAITFDLTFPAGVTFDVPNTETYIIWAASIMNNTVAAEPTVRANYQDHTFHWPTVPVGSGPPGAGLWGSIVDPAFYPQVIPGGSQVNVNDEAMGALHNCTLELLITIVQKEDYNGR